MKKLLILTLVVLFVFGLVFVTGCKKKAADEPVVPTTDKPTTDKPAETPVVPPVDKPAETPVVPPAEK